MPFELNEKDVRKVIGLRKSVCASFEKEMEDRNANEHRQNVGKKCILILHIEAYAEHLVRPESASTEILNFVPRTGKTSVQYQAL